MTRPPAGPGRRLLALVPPIALGLLLGALGVELLARWSWHEKWRDPADHGGPKGVELPVHEQVMDMTRPNLRAVSRNVYFRTNRLGVRGPEHEREPAKGTFRILVTGDSTTMGSGVLEAERYTDRLARRLEAEQPGRRFEVVNIGLSGLNADAVVDRLLHYAPHYPAHLFVYGFTTNDIDGPGYRVRPGRPAAPEYGRLYWEEVSKLERSPSYFWRFLGARRLAGLASEQHAEVVENFDNPEAWSGFLAALDRFAAALPPGPCGHLLVHTDLWDLDESHPPLAIYERVERAARERGLTVTQTFPYFEGRDPAELWVNLFDPHPNAAGHALLAEALYEGLLALPPRCWEPGPALSARAPE